MNSRHEDKITKSAIIEKKANDTIFRIINNGFGYQFEINEVDNSGERIFVFIASLILSVIAIPLWLKKKELEKEYEKNDF